MPSVATQNHAPAQRTREQPQAELEASSELKLGDFSDVPSLSPSEARLLINAVLDARRKLGMKREETEVLIKTQDYLETFSRFKDADQNGAVSALLDAKPQFAFFEGTQLASLCCDNAEEAKSLIPSISNKISDEELQELLDQITKLRSFVE